MNNLLRSKRDNFCQAIQKRRINLGLQLEDLSKLVSDSGINISKNTLKRIEDGSLNPSLDQIFSILNALQCEMSINGELI